MKYFFQHNIYSLDILSVCEINGGPIDNVYSYSGRSIEIKNSVDRIVYRKSDPSHVNVCSSHSNSLARAGQTDIPLSETGHVQAGLVAERLKDRWFTHAFTSDLARANQTAETIMKENRVSSIDLQRDKRLRERKFGEFEGRTVQDLKAKAKEVVGPTRSWMEYNPQGAETYSQLHDRASAFFHELCREIVSSVYDGVGTDLNRKSPRDGTCFLGNTATDSSIEENGFDNKYAKRRKQDGEMMKSQIKHQILPSLNDTSFEKEEFAVSTDKSKSKDVEEGDEWITFEEKKDSKLDVDRTCKEKLDTKEDSNNSRKDKCSRGLSSSVLDLDKEDSKKVKISSSREGSHMDDRDCESHLAADVLLVSHGGFIKELLKYFTQDLGCELPGGNNLAFRICQNCSISKFIVSMSQNNLKLPSIKCLYLNEKNHLKGMEDTTGHY
ncbi:hypothetical protein FSP39_001288 [Pinctada imbricata]|uniref:Fructose-2,6-bisphosphatase TIGAR n=1 Tax=Pinctada imbricata TaxID=66713 RepID=A0AA88YBC7_PINIB|nr:hypothetical protein FSP39_001288 [Pinctada imbricata]